jgi:ABC-type iron transport system FetAB permease component
MVSQHELFGVRFQVDLPAEIGNVEAANVVSDECEGNNERYQAATVVLNQPKQFAPRNVIQVGSKVAGDVLEDVGLAARGCHLGERLHKSLFIARA